MVIYFEEGAIPTNSPKRRIMKNNGSESLINQISSMKLINDSPLTTTGNLITIDSSPAKMNQFANVLAPLINLPQIINNNSPPIINDDLPPINDDKIKDNSLVSTDDDKIPNNESMEDINTENDWEELQRQHDIEIKRFDNQIQDIQIKIQQMSDDLNVLINQKKEKENDFMEKLNEHKRKIKNKKQNQNRSKAIKRIKQTTPRGVGGN